jgi:hypothetical protein
VGYSAIFVFPHAAADVVRTKTGAAPTAHRTPEPRIRRIRWRSASPRSVSAPYPSWWYVGVSLILGRRSYAVMSNRQAGSGSYFTMASASLALRLNPVEKNYTWHRVARCQHRGPFCSHVLAIEGVRCASRALIKQSAVTGPHRVKVSLTPTVHARQQPQL